MGAKRKRARAAAVLVLGACAADERQVERIEPSFIQVGVEGETGSADAPLPFTGNPVEWTLTVATLDRHADPWPFTGDLKVRVRPGRLQMDPWIPVTGGTWTGTVTFEAGFGPTRVWVSDEGDKDSDSGRKASWGTGVTDPIHYAFPTISEMQRIDDIETNQLEGEYAEVAVAGRRVVVSWVGTDGFWATDLDDFVATPEEAAERGLPLGNYASLYVYTFSKPQEVVEGSQLTLLNGGNQEYLATTQLSFPKYEVEEDVLLDVPPYVALDEVTACDDTAMEALEASRVEATGLVVPADFGPGNPDFEDYVAYGQWPAALGSCTIYVDASALEDVDPTEWAGQEVPPVRGLLQQIWDQWIIVANREGEIGDDPEGDDRSARGIHRPRPRSRRGRAAPLRFEPYELHAHRDRTMPCNGTHDGH